MKRLSAPLWMLPERVEDAFPAQASWLEEARKRLWNLFFTHGYEPVLPPLVEHLESLSSGMGQDLEQETMKLVDPLTGRLLGVRADTTLQAARIDAHGLKAEGVMRLAYICPALLAKPRSPWGRREILQAGAEIFGHGGVESDLEIHALAVSALRLLGFSGLHLDFSHMGLLRLLLQKGCPPEKEQEMLSAIALRDKARIKSLLEGMENGLAQSFLALPGLFGEEEALGCAHEVLAHLEGAGPALAALGKALSHARAMGVRVSVDLAGTRGYHYHTGLIFTVYGDGRTEPLALGGRCDNLGAPFGRLRPATGMSLDLRALTPDDEGNTKEAILSPYLPEDRGLAQAVARLRTQGKAVVLELPGAMPTPAHLRLTARLVYQDGHWQVVPERTT